MCPPPWGGGIKRCCDSSICPSVPPGPARCALPKPARCTVPRPGHQSCADCGSICDRRGHIVSTCNTLFKPCYSTHFRWLSPSEIRSIADMKQLFGCVFVLIALLCAPLCCLLAWQAVWWQLHKAHGVRRHSVCATLSWSKLQSRHLKTLRALVCCWCVGFTPVDFVTLSQSCQYEVKSSWTIALLSNDLSQ